MLVLPENFKMKTVNRYDEKGKEWLKNINFLLEKYRKKFKLSQIQLIDNLSINLVLFAKSELYGDVVVKIGAPSPSAISEIILMQKYPQEYIPECYFSSLEDGIMILEKIKPGYPLSDFKDFESRLKIFCNLANHLFIPATNAENFSTFDALVERRIHYAYQNKADFLQYF